MARVTGAAGRAMRVGPVPGLGLPGDEPAVLDPGVADSGAPVHVIVGAVDRIAGGTTLVEVIAGGWRFELEVEPERRALLRERATRAGAAAGSGAAMEVHAMIPGRVVSVSVAAGDAVRIGEQLLVVEAMKMQNEVRSPGDAVVARLAVSAGDTIELGDLLVVLAAHAPPRDAS